MTGRTPETDAPRRLNLNESPFPPPPSVVRAVAKAAAELHRYPLGQEPKLMAALGRYAGVAPERIILSSGSNELLHLLPLFSGATRPGDHVVFANPSFPTYRKVAEFYWLDITAVPLTAAGAADVDAMLAAITPATRLVCVPSPNNPTGEMLTAEEITRLASLMPSDVMLHFDEAYYEFSRASGGPVTLPLLEACAGPWLATRSFSKAFGLAGARLGYGIASDAETAARWRAMRPNFSVTMLAQVAGLAALDARLEAETTIFRITSERAKLAAELEKIGLTPLPSAGNFLAIPAASLGENPVAALADRGILVGSFESRGIPYLRATIGTEADSAALVDALAALKG